MQEGKVVDLENTFKTYLININKAASPGALVSCSRGE